jgi:hypothetical protein
VKYGLVQSIEKGNMMTTPYYVPPNRESVQQTTSTFWAGLFDFSFTRFITLKFIRVIYAVILGVILLSALVAFVISLVGGASNNSVGLIFFGICIVPIFKLLYIVGARLALEFIAVVFRIGENAARIATAEEAQLSLAQAASVRRDPTQSQSGFTADI